MNQLTLQFDAAASRQAKRTGMRRAADARPEALERARAVARELTRNGEVISADEVQAVLRAEGIDLKNAAGSIFVGGDFEHVGYTKSQRPGAHQNLLRTWRRRG